MYVNSEIASSVLIPRREFPATEITNSMIFRLSSKRSPQEVKLLHLEWAVVTQLDGEKTVEDIANLLALSHEETQEIFGKLLEEGLLDLVSVSVNDIYFPEEKFTEIEHHLMKLIGPVADILIRDVLLEMHATPKKLEKDRIPVFVDLLSTFISDSEKKVEFQKLMLKMIKPFLS